MVNLRRASSWRLHLALSHSTARVPHCHGLSQTTPTRSHIDTDVYPVSLAPLRHRSAWSHPVVWENALRNSPWVSTTITVYFPHRQFVIVQAGVLGRSFPRDARALSEWLRGGFPANWGRAPCRHRLDCPSQRRCALSHHEPRGRGVCTNGTPVQSPVIPTMVAGLEVARVLPHRSSQKVTIEREGGFHMKITVFSLFVPKIGTDDDRISP